QQWPAKSQFIVSLRYSMDAIYNAYSYNQSTKSISNAPPRAACRACAGVGAARRRVMTLRVGGGGGGGGGGAPLLRDGGGGRRGARARLEARREGGPQPLHLGAQRR